ncbi:hypothetical protein WKI71_37340 [Streptomyces sp. MS1.AVA.1]|uniref:Uncharacterized protein n=1 Tax=Streptomyces machairae TaxID=3134109 RepID=A0ABU8UTN6_9ACTN
MTRTLRALVYGDVDLNLIDGSAVWAQSTVQALSRAGCDARLLLKSPIRTARLTDPLAELPRVTLVRPHEERLLPGPADRPMSPVQASQVLTRLDDEDPCDLLVLRGRRLVTRVVADGMFDGRIWAYLTDIPQSAAEMTETARAELGRIAEASQRLLCQTEELRCFLETWVPEAYGKCVLSPPAVPEPGFPMPERDAPHDPAARLHRQVRTALEHPAHDPAAGAARPARRPRRTAHRRRQDPRRSGPPGLPGGDGACAGRHPRCPPPRRTAP